MDIKEPGILNKLKALIKALTIDDLSRAILRLDAAQCNSIQSAGDSKTDYHTLLIAAVANELKEHPEHANSIMSRAVSIIGRMSSLGLRPSPASMHALAITGAPVRLLTAMHHVGGDINAVDVSEDVLLATALSMHKAHPEASTALIDALLKSGADADWVNEKSGMNLLMCAASTGQQHLVDAILSYSKDPLSLLNAQTNASIHQDDGGGLSAVDYAELAANNAPLAMYILKEERRLMREHSSGKSSMSPSR